MIANWTHFKSVKASGSTETKYIVTGGEDQQDTDKISSALRAGDMWGYDKKAHANELDVANMRMPLCMRALDMIIHVIIRG